MSEERSISEVLLELLENPDREIPPETPRRILEALVDSHIPEGLEELGRSVLSLWEKLAERIAVVRLRGFIEGGSCPSAGIDSKLCRFLRRLIEAYRAVLLGIVLVDDAGRAYVRLRYDRLVGGLRVPRGGIVAVDVGEAILLYAVGEADLATVKPL